MLDWQLVCILNIVCFHFNIKLSTSICTKEIWQKYGFRGLIQSPCGNINVIMTMGGGGGGGCRCILTFILNFKIHLRMRGLVLILYFLTFAAKFYVCILWYYTVCQQHCCSQSSRDLAPVQSQEGCASDRLQPEELQ